MSTPEYTPLPTDQSHRRSDYLLQAMASIYMLFIVSVFWSVPNKEEALVNLFKTFQCEEILFAIYPQYAGGISNFPTLDEIEDFKTCIKNRVEKAGSRYQVRFFGMLAMTISDTKRNSQSFWRFIFEKQVFKVLIIGEPGQRLTNYATAAELQRDLLKFLDSLKP